MLDPQYFAAVLAREIIEPLAMDDHLLGLDEDLQLSWLEASDELGERFEVR